MMTISNVLKTTEYGLPNAPTPLAGEHCGGSIPCLPTSSGLPGPQVFAQLPRGAATGITATDIR